MYELQIPSDVICGRGALAQMLAHVKASGVERVGLLVDGAVYRQPAVEALVQELRACMQAVSLVSDIPAEPSVAQVLEVYAGLNRTRGGMQMVIAIGGGSTLDTAKIICAMLTNPAYADDVTDVNRIVAKPCPLYVAPTSAGTGAEATINAIVLIPEKKVKQGVVHPFFLPQKVFLDAELTRSLPPKLTASTGLDAFCHCIETYISRKHTPFSRLYALEGLRLIARYLLRAYRDGEDMEAREGMLLAAFYGGVAIRCSSTVAVHALSYPLGGAYHIPHGIANAMLLPYVIAFNMDALGDDLYAIAEAMGLELPADDRAASEQAVVDAIFAMTTELGIPNRLSVFGVPASDLDFLVESAAGVRRLLDQNPKPMSRDDIASVYAKLFEKEAE